MLDLDPELCESSYPDLEKIGIFFLFFVIPLTFFVFFIFPFSAGEQADQDRTAGLNFKGNFFKKRDFFIYFIRHCFICCPQIPLCRKLLESSPGLLRLWHWTVTFFLINSNFVTLFVKLSVVL